MPSHPMPHPRQLPRLAPCALRSHEASILTGQNSRRSFRFAVGLWRPLQASASTKQHRALSVLRLGSQTKFDNNFSLKVCDGRSLKGDSPSALFAKFQFYLDMRKSFSQKKKRRVGTWPRISRAPTNISSKKATETPCTVQPQP